MSYLDRNCHYLAGEKLKAVNPSQKKGTAELPDGEVNWSIDTQFAIKTKLSFPSITYLTNTKCVADLNDNRRGIPLENVILTLTAGTNVKNRNVLRKNFFTPPGWRRFFMLGIPVKKSDHFTKCDGSNASECVVDEKLKALLLEEQSKYGDLVIGNYLDTYQRLTLKTVAALSWAANHCSTARFVFKFDDDVGLNYRFLANMLQQYEVKNRTSNLWEGEKFTFKPIRSGYRNFLTEEEFPDSQYPYYARGGGYWMSIDVAKHVVEMSTKLHFIAIEDVWVGIAGHLSGLRVENTTTEGVLTDSIPCKTAFSELTRSLVDIIMEWANCEYEYSWSRRAKKVTRTPETLIIADKRKVSTSATQTADDNKGMKSVTPPTTFFDQTNVFLSTHGNSSST